MAADNQQGKEHVMEPVTALLIGLGTFAVAQDIDAKYRAAYGYRYYAQAVQAEPAQPPVPAVAYVPSAPAYAAPARERAAPARSPQSTDQYLQRWQGFMEPVARR
jgi:hypothetical protein